MEGINSSFDEPGVSVTNPLERTRLFALKSLREESSSASAQALPGTALPHDPSQGNDTRPFYKCQTCGTLLAQNR
jgi:hypothetical protein